MTDLRDAAQQALEALELTYSATSEHCDTQWKAIAALRAALEQPEQEPVAWMVYTQDGKSVCVTDNPADFIEWRSFPLYTHPPRCEWRGLTEEEIIDAVRESDLDWHQGWTLEEGEPNRYTQLVRAVGVALRSKNHE
jgi:hypothetical protein